MNCAELAEQITEYLEGALPAPRSADLARHLDRCSDCDVYLDQMRRTIELTGRLDPEAVAAVPAATRARLEAAFRAQTPEERL